MFILTSLVAAFQFTRIGDDPEALELFQSLAASDAVGNNIDYLSGVYMNENPTFPLSNREKIASDVLGDEGNTERRWKEVSYQFA